jgi:putative endonuclease
MGGRTYYVYLLANRSGTVYVGVTNELERRVLEHRQGLFPGFTKQYKVNSLVYYEEFDYIEDAIQREKQIKAWRREKKDALVNAINPKWKDLAADWFSAE